MTWRSSGSTPTLTRTAELEQTTALLRSALDVAVGAWEPAAGPSFRSVTGAAPQSAQAGTPPRPARLVTYSNGDQTPPSSTPNGQAAARNP